MNANLSQSVSLYRMDKDENIEKVMGDPTEMFPESLSGIGSGFGRRENQYIWRMNVYEGKLYVGTFDTSSLLHPITQLVNGDLANMSGEEWERLIGFIRELTALQNPESEEGQSIANALEKTSDQHLAAMFSGKTELEPMTADGTDYSALYEAVVSLAEVACRTKDATRGFDLYVTEDGVNFECITIDGFGDPYNHGCRVFANTAGGMVIGTANPFYATQVWLMKGACRGDEDCPSAHLTDVDPNAWYHLAVDYCVENGIMEGIGGNLFGISLDTNRAQLVTMLWRQMGCPEPEMQAPFSDVPAGSFYEKAVSWAYEYGIVNGVFETAFNPNGKLTREQFVAILYRYADYVLWADVSARADLSVFADGDEISAYARDAMSWAVAVGLLKGMPEGENLILNPQGNANRAQAATVFHRFCKVDLY